MMTPARESIIRATWARSGHAAEFHRAHPVWSAAIFHPAIRPPDSYDPAKPIDASAYKLDFRLETHGLEDGGRHYRVTCEGVIVEEWFSGGHKQRGHKRG